MDIATLSCLAESFFPVRMGLVDLLFVELTEAETDDVEAMLRLLRWESADDRTIRDIKEQPVLFVPAEHRSDDRIGPALQAWQTALTRLAGEHDLATHADRWMPADLWFLPELLSLRSAHTADDFARLLDTPRRLGRLLKQ